MQLPHFQFAGARALVLLHDQHMRSFMDTWANARAAQVRIPPTEDPDYASIEAVGVHVLGCARYYMEWCCEQLALPAPGIDAPPGVDRVGAEGGDYLEHLLERWKAPLAGVPPEAFDSEDFLSRWGRAFSIDSMLEHAVMHPIRHEFQAASWLQSDS